MDQELIDALARQHIGIDETNVAQALAQREPVRIADLKEQPPSAVNEIILRAGFVSQCASPLSELRRLCNSRNVVSVLTMRGRAAHARSHPLVSTFGASIPRSLNHQLSCVPMPRQSRVRVLYVVAQVLRGLL